MTTLPFELPTASTCLTGDHETHSGNSLMNTVIEVDAYYFQDLFNFRQGDVSHSLHHHALRPGGHIDHLHALRRNVEQRQNGALIDQHGDDVALEVPSEIDDAAETKVP